MLNLKAFVNNPLGPKVRDLSLKDRERLFFLMAQMLRSGQTAEGALRTVAKAFKLERKEDIFNGLNTIAQKVAQGRPLSRAMESEYVMFSDIHRAAVMAGEAANSMYESFKVLRELEARKMEQRRSGLAEVITPTAMFLLSCASIMNTGINTLPALAALKKAEGKPLGVVTQSVMDTTAFIAGHWYLIVALIIVLVISTYSAIRTPQGKFWLDYYLLKVPVLGQFMAYKVYTNMLLYFPSMIASGVKPKQMIPIMEALATNLVLKRRIDLFNQMITAGGKMSDAMEKAGFPPIAVTPIRVSEHYAGSSSDVNDVMIEGMQHSYAILDRDLTDAQARFVAIISSVMWLLGGLLMLTEMLSIIFAQSV